MFPSGLRSPLAGEDSRYVAPVKLKHIKRYKVDWKMSQMSREKIVLDFAAQTQE